MGESCACLPRVSLPQTANRGELRDSRKPMDLLSGLPTEVARQVLSYLDASELAACSSVCLDWRRLVDCPLLWKRHCLRLGWTDTHFVDSDRTHWPQEEERESLWKMNKWAENYRRRVRLPKSWATDGSRSYLLSPSEEEATVLACDEATLAVGHSDGTVSILDVWRTPKCLSTLRALLPGFKVLAIALSGPFLVLLQAMLIQIFVRGDRGVYTLVDAKSFQLGFIMIEALQKFQGGREHFGCWYAQKIGGDKYVKERMAAVVNFILVEGVIFVCVRDYQMIYGWSLENGRRLYTIHIPNRTCKLRDMTINDDGMYIIYASRNIRHITKYDMNRERFAFELTTPECKTQKLIAGHFLIGIAISGPGVTSAGMIKVWEKGSGKEVACRQIGYVTFKTVVELYDLIAYGEGTTVYLWEPRTDSLLRRMSTDGRISYLLPCPFRFLLVITTTSARLWDWLLGTQLYRLYPLPVVGADYRGLVYADQTMLLLKVDTAVIEMRTFC